MDFATYLLWAISDVDAFPRASGMEEALNMISANVERQSLGRIAFLGNIGDFRDQHAEALKILQSEIAEQNKRHHEPEEGNASNPEGPSTFDPFK